MPRTGTASDFILTTLRQHRDREMTLADLFALAEGKFSKENMRASLDRFVIQGKVVRNRDGGAVWWAISTSALQPD
jgi:DNA-binding transcriptional regulator PaaX